MKRIFSVLILVLLLFSAARKMLRRSMRSSSRIIPYTGEDILFTVDEKPNDHNTFYLDYEFEIK